jgi:putative ABC transport system permease protein
MSAVLGGLAILLSCLGLYGLSSYSVERRNREIGIRKVLGASSGTIVSLLSRGFLKLVLIADLIAIPIAYFLMYQLIHFLYAYPVSINAGIFVLIPALSLLLAFLVVSSQTWKSALANPADSLKYE